MLSVSKTFYTLIVLPVALYSVDPTTYGTNFGIRQIAVQIASANAIPVYGPGNPAINQSGIYALANDIDGALLIEHDNVILSLNGYRVKGSSLSDYAILIDGYKHITIGDGVIGPDTPGTVTAGIKISNTQDVYLENCNIINTQQGIDAQSSSNLFTKNCRSQFFTQTGFNSDGCTTCILENCYALTSTANSNNTPTNISGFSCVNGINNMFQECLASDLISTTTMRYAGFYLQDSNKIGIRNCMVDMIQTGSLGYGIYLFYQPTLWDGIPGTNTATNISNKPTQNANSPQIAFDTSGHALAIWYENNGTPTNIYARYFDGTDWSATATNISTNTGQPAGSPKIAFDAAGHALAVWQEDNSTTLQYNIYARSFDGTDWSATATDISNNQGQPAYNPQIYNPQIAFNTNDNAIAVWQENNSATSKSNIYARYFDGTYWSAAATNISNDPTQNAYNAQIAFDTTGHALAIWQENNSATSQANIYARYFDGTDWSATATDISNDPTQNANNSQIAFDTTGNALAIWSEYNLAKNQSNIYVRYFDGTNWDPTATNISNDTTQNANICQIAFDSNGNALAIWQESNGIASYNIYVRYFDGTNWDPAATDISNDPNQTAQYPQIAFDTTGTALAVWQENNGTPTNIYARRSIPESKNANCITTDNRISNINTTPKTGMGIYGDEQYNNFSQNIAAWCDLAYRSSITNVQSGYTGSNFMYNVALPS